MENLSARVANMAPSATMAMNAKTREMKAKGVPVINLSVGEPDFFTPDHIKEAAIKAIEDNITFYPPAAGFPDLREAISRKLQRENNLQYSPEQIVVSCGAKNSLANAILSLIEKDDEVIVPAPYWVTYAELVKLAEGKNIYLPSSYKTNFKVSASEIEAAITPKTKAILLCSPSNPSGAIYSKEELEEIAKVVEKHPRIFVISDEIYEHINFVGQHETIAQFDSIKERVVLINGVSKAYAMTGWRIGYMAAAPWLAKACIKLQGQLLTGANTIAMKASVTALDGDQACVAEMKIAFERRKNLMMDHMNSMPGLKTMVPEGAFYVFPDVSSYFGKSDGTTTINNTSDMCMYLIEKAYIGTVPGSAFGDDNCIRISYANSDDNLNEAMKRMKEALLKLK